MTCKEIENLLPAMIDDALPDTERKRIEAHLGSCVTCRKALADLRQSVERLKGLEEVEPPPWLKTRVMARVREEAGQKEGIFRKLFYPLHVKVPIQALATVLIAVVAWNVYQTGEPEFSRIVPPPVAVQEVPKSQASETQNAPQRSPVPVAGKIVSDQRLETREKKAIAPSSSAGEDQGMRKEATVREAAKADAARPAAVPLKDEEVRNRTGAMGQAEMDRTARTPDREQKQKAMKAPAGPVAKETRKRETAPAAPPMLSAATPAQPVPEMILRARDPEAAAGEVETIVNQIGARTLGRQSREDRVTLTVKIQAESLDAFRERLKPLGPIGEKQGVFATREGDLTIRIEIRPDEAGSGSGIP